MTCVAYPCYLSRFSTVRPSHNAASFTYTSVGSYPNVAYVKEVGDALPMDLIQNLFKLTRIGDLPQNWNGYGAQPFSYDVIQHSRKVLALLPVQPFISPTARNSIQMEYERANGDYFELELFDDYFTIYSCIGETEFEHRYAYTETNEKRLIEGVESFCE